jgi:hypothetical protein
MQIVRLVVQSRKLLALGLMGAVAVLAGCGSGGNPGESNAAPTTPPPGQGGADMKSAMEKAYGPTGTPPSTKEGQSKAP